VAKKNKSGTIASSNDPVELAKKLCEKRFRVILDGKMTASHEFKVMRKQFAKLVHTASIKQESKS
jgi:hypothetical protein